MNPEEVQCIEACQFPGTPNQANSRPRNKAFQNPVHMTYLVSHSSPKLSLNQVARAMPVEIRACGSIDPRLDKFWTFHIIWTLDTSIALA